MHISKLALIVAFSLSSGCAAWRTSGGDWQPPLSHSSAPASGPELGVRLWMWDEDDRIKSLSWDEASPTGGIRFGKFLKEELEQSHWFSKVEPGLDSGTVHADLQLARVQEGPLRMGRHDPLVLVPIFTLGLLPTTLHIQWSLDARFTDAGGRVVDYAVSETELELVWLGAIPIAPFAWTFTLEDRIVRDLYRRVFESARADGMFDVAGSGIGRS